MKDFNLVIVSGISGSGKSTALKTLEDLGFFCIDNLPVMLLPAFLKLCGKFSSKISNVGLVMDIRERMFLSQYIPTIRKIKEDGYRVRLFFLDADDNAIVKRFRETRRQHPLAEKGSVLEGVQKERAELEEIKASAEKVIDTTQMNVHQLRGFFQNLFKDVSDHLMAITFMSFGFKYGLPQEVDMVFDVRFLPNPFFNENLKDLNGTNSRVSSYILNVRESIVYLEKLRDFLSYQIPLFKKEGKSYLTIAVGCTGGRHRSVAVSNYLRDFFSDDNQHAYVIHRDIEKGI